MFRFAPSPTGDIHIGNLRIAIINHILAKQTHERLIIRFEDTDHSKNIEGKDQETLQLLTHFGIAYDDVIYQSANLKFHQQLASKLLMDKKAFCCFCTQESLDKKRAQAKVDKVPYLYDNTCTNLPDSAVIDNQNPFVVRLKKPEDPLSIKDEIKGNITFSPNDVDSFIILKQNNHPTYNFASAIDDMLSNIGYIIRGEDHISNTPKQIAIQRYLGYDSTIKYAHLPIILNKDGKKMSECDQDSNIKWLLSEGFLPSAIVNYLLLIGNKTPKEIFMLDEAVEFFDIHKLSKSPAKFDLDRLRHINREHIKRLDDVELSVIFGFKDKHIGQLAKLYTEESSTLNEIQTKIEKIFAPKEAPKRYKEEFNKLKAIAQDAPYFDRYGDFKRYLMSESELKSDAFLQPLRILLTGSEHGPNLSDLYPYIKSYLGEIIR
jgi:glutamyl-tRNA synthetase